MVAGDGEDANKSGKATPKARVNHGLTSKDRDLAIGRCRSSDFHNSLERKKSLFNFQGTHGHRLAHGDSGG
jgi:hypothetical protein